MTQIAMSRTVGLSYEEAVQACRTALADEGFGVLTEIDVKATLAEKLGVDRSPYMILGACHPESAHRVLQAASEVGVLLPCNVTVSVEDNGVVVQAMDPSAVMTMIDDPIVSEVAADIRSRLERVIDAVG